MVWLVSARRWRYHVPYTPNNRGKLTDGAPKQAAKQMEHRETDNRRAWGNRSYRAGRLRVEG